jgi:hypothetical protein
MAADTIFFFNNLLHYANALGLLTYSNTANGYSADAVRDPNFMTAWKPPDSETVDEYLQWDGGSTTWLGAATETAYCAVAYDARGADQTQFALNTDAADSPAGTFTQSKASFTLEKTSIGVQWASFSISSPAKQHYRLWQSAGSGRGGGTGKTKTAKVYAWAMFDKDTVYAMASSFAADAVGPHDFGVLDRVGLERTGIGAAVSNTFAASGQSFDVSFQPASKALYEAIRDKLMLQGGAATPNFIQHEGVRNPSQPNFHLCRLMQDRWGGHKPFLDLHEMSLPFVTEAWF